MKTLSTALIGIMAVTATACTTADTTPPSEVVEAAKMSNYSGTVTYRERITPPSGSSVIVKLLDVSRADAASITLDEQIIPLEGRSVPVAYDLSVETDILNPKMRYAVRADIRDSVGDLLWTSDQSQPIDPEATAQALQPLVLKRVSQQTQSQNGLSSAKWTVTHINGTPVNYSGATHMQFTAGGALSGMAGCNNFATEFTQMNGILSIKPAAVTKKACVPGLDAQENSFLSVFNDVDRYSFDQTGNLVLKTEDGRTINTTK